MKATSLANRKVKIMLAVHIATKLNRNGNSRHGWIIVDEYGAVNDFVDEDSDGHFTAVYPNLNTTVRITVVPAEFKHWVAFGKKRREDLGRTGCEMARKAK